MAYFEYDPFAQYVAFQYKCPECHRITNSGLMAVPNADFSAENQADSEVEREEECSCEHCGHTINVDLVTGMYQGYATIYDLEDEALINYHEEYDDYDEGVSLEDDEQNYGFYTDAHRALDAIDALPKEAKATLYRLLYANAIAYLEAYLSGKLKTLVFSNKDLLRRFVENCDEFKKRTLTLDKIFTRKEHIAQEIRTYLDGIVYHRFSLVKRLYMNCVGIDLGNMDKLKSALSIRHDIVHRNGKTKEGTEHNITKAEVEQVWEDVYEIITRVDSQEARMILGDFVDEVEKVEVPNKEEEEEEGSINRPF